MEQRNRHRKINCPHCEWRDWETYVWVGVLWVAFIVVALSIVATGQR